MILYFADAAAELLHHQKVKHYRNIFQITFSEVFDFKSQEHTILTGS